MEETYKKQGYTITERTDLFDEEYGITPQLSDQLAKLYVASQNRDECEQVIEQLQRLILEYPKCPSLKNYLSIAYRTLGHIDKAKEINERIIDQHPGYLYARINKAANHLENDEFSEVLNVLGEDLCIKKLYSERTVFHINEISSYLGITILYYDAIGNKKKKGKQLSLLDKIYPEKVEEIRDKIIYRNMLSMQKEIEAERMAYKKDRNDIALPTSQDTAPPAFHHAEINNLYMHGMDISVDMLNEIIALPRKNLIADLELVLIDAVDRYSYFDTQEWTDSTHSFPLHALYLLTELKAEESLQTALSLFTNNHKLLDNWFGDLLTEKLWQCFLVLGFNDLQSMKQYLLTPHLNPFTKCPITEALSQMVLHYPERRDEILDVYSQILKYYIDTPEEESHVDPEFLGLLISDIIDAKLIELLPLIKMLYQMNNVSHYVNGDYKDALRHMTSKRDHKRRIDTLEEFYKFSMNFHTALDDFASSVDDDNDEDGYYIPPRSFSPVSIASKIGRNDPCPCGSGKKHKKCCLA